MKTNHTSLGQRLGACVTDPLGPALKTGLWLLYLTVPVSFAVLILKVTGGLDIISRLLGPVFALFSLPGESAVVFATACLLNIYACIAVIETLELTSRTVTILALMCLISHNLPVETAVQKKAGSSFTGILVMRLCASFFAAFMLGRLLPPDAVQAVASAGAENAATAPGFLAELGSWAESISLLCVKIMVLITLLMILQRLLEEFGVIELLSRFFQYPLMLLGIPREAAFLWFVANTLGLAYGAGIIIDHIERGKLSRENADILNTHIAISHSLLEDTLLFVAIGVSVWWITIPRVILAGMAVWLKRLWRSLFRAKNPAKNA